MAQPRKRRRQKPGRFLNMLILVIMVLIVFEGKLLINIFQKDNIKSQVTSQIDELLLANGVKETEAATEAVKKAPSTEAPQTEAQPSVSDAIVPQQTTPVDDSYFSDAVFIGDSRMEGFRNQSGITQGTFLTGVGMDAVNIFEKPYISLYNEELTVFQAMYDTDYKKVYVMIGTNDLGEPDFNDFKTQYKQCLAEIRKQAPNAIMYVISVAYVEESKVTTGEYVNNANIDAINEKILELCEEEGYHYLNINEVLSDGNHSLIADATSDGIHMYDTYCKIWLDYLKNHYVPEGSTSKKAEPQTSASNESETTAESSSEKSISN